MAISYLICAAGLGTRTQKINPHIPKPLLKLQGQSLLELSLLSLPLKAEDQLIIIHSAEISEDSFRSALGSFTDHPGLTFVITPLTRGQLETAYAALQSIPAANSVCVFNSDTFFECSRFHAEAHSGKWDGLIPCSVQPGDSWSFCQVSDKINGGYAVTEVAEKKRISDWCSVGLYWFKTKDLFKKYADLEMQNIPAGKEIYVAPMYNAMIKAGLTVGMLECEQFKPMGSVDQIEKYWGLSLVQMIKENQD